MSNNSNEYTISNSPEARAEALELAAQAKAEAESNPQRMTATVEQSRNLEYRNGQVYDRTPTGWVSSDDAVARPQGGVLSTARTSFGSAVAPSFVRDDTLVTYAGITMEARHAVNLGLLHRNADGSYSETQATNRPTEAQGSTSQRSQAGQGNNNEMVDGEGVAPALLPDTEEAFVARLNNTTDANTINVMVEAAIASEIDPDSSHGVSAEVVEKIAHRLEMSPENAEKYIERLTDSFRDLANRALTGFGVPEAELDHFKHYASTRHPRLFNEAINRLIGQRDVSGFRRLAYAYMNVRGR